METALARRRIVTATANATGIAADTTALESEIDTLVYKLYNLTPAEIQTVEGKQ
jgi:hypothetical protein